jgi:hypothetical protein
MKKSDYDAAAKILHGYMCKRCAKGWQGRAKFSHVGRGGPLRVEFQGKKRAIDAHIWCLFDLGVFLEDLARAENGDVAVNPVTVDNSEKSEK